MVACPIRLQERCEIFTARMFANHSRPEHGPESVLGCDGSHPAPWLSTMKSEQLQVVSGIVSVRDVFAVLRPASARACATRARQQRSSWSFFNGHQSTGILTGHF